MASILDYFSPGEMPSAQPDQNIMPSIASFMSDPKALNALLAFGTQAMIPQWGGGSVQFAKGVGAAGEAASAQEASSQKQQELDSKSQLREAQAGAAEARANTAGTRASLIGQVEEGKMQRANDLNRVRLQNHYAAYTRGISRDNEAIRKANNDVLRPPGTPPTPEKTTMSQEEWIRNSPMLKNLGLLPPGAAPTGAEDDALPPGATLDSGTTGPATAARPATPVGMKQVVQKGPYAGKEVEWNGSEWKLVGK
jgi:hypothetical protein